MNLLFWWGKDRLFKKRSEITRSRPISSFLTCCNLFPVSDHSIGSHFRAGSVINVEPTEEPLSPPIYTSKAVTYRGLKQNSEGSSFVPLTSILGLYLLSVGGKLRQLFFPRMSSFPPIWNLSRSNTFPLEAFNVDVAKLSQPVTHSVPGCQGRLEWAASTKWDKKITQGVSEARARPRENPASCSWPWGHDSLPTATLGTGSVAKRINTEDCGSLKHLGIPQKFHVIYPEKNNQPKHWAPTNSFEQLLICISFPPPEALPVASLPPPCSSGMLPGLWL